MRNLHTGECSIPACVTCGVLYAGIVDDVYGADFVNGGKDGDVQDQNGHGTFVSGVVGAIGNNNLGVTGINQVLALPGGSLLHWRQLGWPSWVGHATRVATKGCQATSCAAQPAKKLLQHPAPPPVSAQGLSVRI